jgi:TonB family protein
MNSNSRRFIRFAGAVSAACVVVALIMIASLWAFGFLDRPKGHHAVDLRLLTLSERLDLAEALGERSVDERPVLPPLEEIPPLEIPRRQEPGFVQVEFFVDDQGRVTDAEVVRSMPEGFFDQQALEIVRSRQYAAGEGGRRTDVVDFTVERAEE